MEIAWNSRTKAEIIGALLFSKSFESNDGRGDYVLALVRLLDSLIVVNRDNTGKFIKKEDNQ